MLELLTALTLTASPAAVAPPTSAHATLAVAAVVSDKAAYEAAKKAAEVAFLKDIKELASWCQKNKAYLERNRAYELLLEFEPDHKDARKALGYSWDRKAEEWVRKRRYREPKNMKPATALEALEMRERMFEAHTERLITAIEKHADALDSRTKKRDLEPLVAERPDDERLRALLGQVKMKEEGSKKEERWVSAAVAEAVGRRAQYKQLRDRTRGAAPEPTETEPEVDETGLGFDWRQTKDNGSGRVLSTGDAMETERILKNSHLLWEYLPQVLGGDLTVPENFTMYLLTTPDAKVKFRDNFSLVSEDNRKYWDKMVGTFIGPTVRMALYNSNSPGRVDMACRLTIGLYLWMEYGVRGKRGWATEGFGLYLTHQITGTRLSYTLNASEYEDTSDRNYQDRIEKADSDWLELARRMLRDDKAPNLAFVLGKDVGAMSPRDLIIANALAAYLIEGKGPEVTGQVLRGIGERWVDGQAVPPEKPAAKVLEEALDAPLPDIYGLLLEWLTEVKRR